MTIRRIYKENSIKANRHFYKHKQSKQPPQIQLEGMGPAANAFLWHQSPGNASGDSNHLFGNGVLENLIQALSRTFRHRCKDFQGPCLFSRTFQALKIWKNNSRTFKDPQEPCLTLTLTITLTIVRQPHSLLARQSDALSVTEACVIEMVNLWNRTIPSQKVAEMII